MCAELDKLLLCLHKHFAFYSSIIFLMYNIGTFVFSAKLHLNVLHMAFVLIV